MPIDDENDGTAVPGEGGAAAPAPAPAGDDVLPGQNGDGTLQSGSDKETLDDKAVAAFMKGVEEATPAPAPTAEEAARGAAPAPAPAAASPAAAPAAAKPGDKGAGAAPAPAAAAPAPPKDEATENEIKSLNLKEKAAERFRELSSTVKEQTPYVQTLREVGIDTPQKLTSILNDAARGLEFEDALQRVQAQPEQFSSALQIIGAMNSGDPRLMNAAFDAMSETLTNLGQRLGREVGGAGADPLAAHPDLLREVEEQTLDRKHALEIARARGSERLGREHLQRQNQQASQERESQQQMSRVQQAAMSDIDAFSDEMEKTDPHFAHRLAILTPQLDTITRGFPPSRWALEVQKAYRQIPAPAAAPAAAPVASGGRPRLSHMPTRGGAGVNGTAGAGGGAMRTEPKSDFEAFMQGVRDATPMRK